MAALHRTDRVDAAAVVRLRSHQPPGKMKTVWRHIGVLVIFLMLCSPAAEAGGGNSTTCPLDLGYVATFPWDTAPCAPPVTNRTACCTTLLSVLAVGLAARLRATGRFRLPSAPASAACLRAFSGTLVAPPLSLPASLVPDCFPVPSQFAISPDYCAGVTTAAQYVAVVGNASVAGLNASCGSDLTSMSLCSPCLTAGIDASSRLTVAAGNGSKSLNCFYLTVLFAAGVSNFAGPAYPATASCIFGLALSTPSPTSSPTSSSTNHSNIAVAITIPIASVLLVSLIALLLWRKRTEETKNRSIHISEERRSRPRPNTGSVLFDIGELAKATGGFAERNLIGRGGFGVVYRGVIADGTVVAVKKMLDPDVEDGDEEFTNEVEIISQLRHRNLVPLRGCCIADDDADEGKQMFLVYDYMPKGSLDQYIFEDVEGRRRPALSWDQRRSVILDVARGLEYLHYGVKPGIYHRDIKATNILLDADMRARVADFGLARRSREGQSHLTTRVAGTHGYLSPEYALYGQLTEKSDVYSFGVLVLEVMSGRRALDLTDPSGVVLITDWAWTLVKAGRAREVLAKALREEHSTSVVALERFVLVGILCEHVTVACRPTMPEALRMLEGDMDVPDLPDRPQPLGQRIAFDGGESNFSASTVLSGPFVDFGDMLR
ncbi:probable receptor-like protein kinase At1g11050 [Phragmites australis]|uniref:probable receptor-like protein kinase At1g11050 n=1 Tax=Phragmites australis TaxID=29695 RepID=UPI002D7A3011|nr:probable receptor-like protein kinase At1g11050 [Phragmites australis]